MIAEFANGSIGYIPNRIAYPQGNYEVLSARCGEGSGELLVDAALRLLRGHCDEEIRLAANCSRPLCRTILRAEADTLRSVRSMGSRRESGKVSVQENGRLMTFRGNG
jgi:hypothetical protein